MGRHYVPRFYLQGFTETNGRNFIWVYEKGSKETFRTNIINIAQQNRFYTDATEEYLANDIEDPAVAIIEKIETQSPLTDKDKRILAEFIVTQYKRVPEGLKRAEGWYDEISDQVYIQMINEIDELISKNPPNKKQLQKRKKEIQHYYEEDPTNPKEIWENILPSGMSTESVNTFLNMEWRFFSNNKKPIFLTNDNPVFFFQSLGIGKQVSELTFPISKHISLWATWRTDIKKNYLPAKNRIVREINRRTVSNATKYIFYPQKQMWIINLVNKKDIQLNFIK